MSEIRRIYVEKKDAFAVEAKGLLADLKNNLLVITDLDTGEQYEMQSVKNIKQLIEIPNLVSCDKEIAILTSDGKIYYSFNQSLINIKDIEKEFSIISSIPFAKIGYAFNSNAIPDGGVPGYKLAAVAYDGTERIYDGESWHIIK